MISSIHYHAKSYDLRHKIYAFIGRYEPAYSSGAENMQGSQVKKKAQFLQISAVLAKAPPCTVTEVPSRR